jgi:uncharacterized membrane protein (UPF0127 family)
MRPNKKLFECCGMSQWGMRRIIIVMLALPALIVLIAGQGGPVLGGPNRYPRLPVVPVKLGIKTIKLWVAATTRTRDRGLMYLHHMPGNRGMLFVFQHNGPQTFWMKHTFIPLDLVFLNQQGVIVRHYTMQPDHGRKLYPSGQPIRFAIELNAGAFKDLQLHHAMRIHIPLLPASDRLKSSGAS